MVTWSGALQHGLDVVGDGEGRLRLGPHLIDGDAAGELDEREAGAEVDVEDALQLPGQLVHAEESEDIRGIPVLPAGGPNETGGDSRHSPDP